MHPLIILISHNPLLCFKMNSQNKDNKKHIIDANMANMKRFIAKQETMTYDDMYEYERAEIIKLLTGYINNNNLKQRILNGIKKSFTNGKSYIFELKCDKELENIRLNTTTYEYIAFDKELLGRLNNKTSIGTLDNLFQGSGGRISLRIGEYELIDGEEVYYNSIVVKFDPKNPDYESYDKRPTMFSLYYDIANNPVNEYDDIIDVVDGDIRVFNDLSLKKIDNDIVNDNIDNKNIISPNIDKDNFNLIRKISEKMLELGIDNKIKQEFVVKNLKFRRFLKFLETNFNDQDKDRFDDGYETYQKLEYNITLNDNYNNYFNHKNKSDYPFFDPDIFLKMNKNNMVKIFKYDDDVKYIFTVDENNFLNDILKFGKGCTITYKIEYSHCDGVVMICDTLVGDRHIKKPGNIVFHQFMVEGDYERRFDEFIRSKAIEIAMEIPTLVDNFNVKFRNLQANRKKTIESNKTKGKKKEVLQDTHAISFYYHRKFGDYFIKQKQHECKFDNYFYVGETILQELCSDDFLTNDMNEKINDMFNVRGFKFRYDPGAYEMSSCHITSSLALCFTPPKYLLLNK